MNEKLTQQYDSLYSSEDNVFGEGKPIPAVMKLTEYLPAGSVLDIGGGEGRNSLFLAREGYEVTVTDLSQVGIQKILQVAEAEGLEIDGRVEDVTREGIVGTYDAMVCTFVMHHMDGAAARRLIADMQSHTNLGGVNVIATFLNEGGLYERNLKSASGRFYPSESEMCEMYDGWELLIVQSRETTTHAKDKEGNHMRNHMIILIAKKPEIAE